MRSPNTIFKTSKEIYQRDGLKSLLKRGFVFVLGQFIRYKTYYVYLNDGEGFRSVKQDDFIPKVDNMTIKTVCTNDEADELEAQGFEFRRYADNARKKLDAGAMAFCIFVSCQLATIGWFCTTQRAKDSLNEPPVKVDFLNGEGWVGNSWTNPKYRQMGLNTYNSIKMIEYLMETGIVLRDRYVIAKNNAPALRADDKFGNIRYAEGRWIKVLWWRSWREKPLTTPERRTIRQQSK